MFLDGFIEFRRQFPQLCERSCETATPSITAAAAAADDDDDALTLRRAALPRSSLSLSVSHPALNRAAAASAASSSSSSTAAAAAAADTTATTPTEPPLTPIVGGAAGDDDAAANAPITQLFDFLYLGSQDDAQNSALLKRYGITRIINLSDAPARHDLIPNDAQHFLRIPIKDSYAAKIWPHFDEAFSFIGKQANETRATFFFVRRFGKLA